MNIFEKYARRITRLSWNHTVHHIILEAMKRRIINSQQGHAILGAWNAECFPERGHASFLKAVEHSVQPTSATCPNCGEKMFERYTGSWACPECGTCG